MKTLIQILVVWVIVCSWNVQADEHYCDDAQGWAEWVALIKKYPNDDNLRAAYALRLGLCQEIKAGTIETGRAIHIFNRFMDALKMDALKREAGQAEQKQSIQ